MGLQGTLNYNLTLGEKQGGGGGGGVLHLCQYYTFNWGKTYRLILNISGKREVTALNIHECIHTYVNVYMRAQ